MGISEDFIKSLSDIQYQASQRASESFKFRTTLSGQQRDLIQGVNNVPENEGSYIRNESGRTLFMIGIDRVGRASIVGK